MCQELAEDQGCLGPLEGVRVGGEVLGEGAGGVVLLLLHHGLVVGLLAQAAQLLLARHGGQEEGVLQFLVSLQAT